MSESLRVFLVTRAARFFKPVAATFATAEADNYRLLNLRQIGFASGERLDQHFKI